MLLAVKIFYIVVLINFEPVALAWFRLIGSVLVVFNAALRKN
tara:strand:+ start:391 stop:516 length:126 start_codon:yes stop_codon:yes gene_type:complete